MDIQTELYHQKFDDATSRWLDLMRKYDLSELTQNLSYTDFIELMEFSDIRRRSADLGSNADRDYYKLLDLRMKYFPKDAEKATYQYYRDPRTFFLSCNYASSYLIDTVYINWCMMKNVTVNVHNKKQIWSNIQLLYKRNLHSKNLANLGTIGFILQAYAHEYPEFRNNTKPLLLTIGRRMIDIDPHWMNGYDILISGYDKKSDKYQETINLTRENYIGDPSRLDSVMKDLENQ